MNTPFRPMLTYSGILTPKSFSGDRYSVTVPPSAKVFDGGEGRSMEIVRRVAAIKFECLKRAVAEHGDAIPQVCMHLMWQ